jgi:hypothetical protein
VVGPGQGGGSHGLGGSGSRGEGKKEAAACKLESHQSSTAMAVTAEFR